MRKNLKAKALVYPQPVFIIATYNEDGSTNAMNAAWGCVADINKVAIYMAKNHKTYENICNTQAFTVSMALQNMSNKQIMLELSVQMMSYINLIIQVGIVLKVTTLMLQ